MSTVLTEKIDEFQTNVMRLFSISNLSENLLLMREWELTC